MCSKPPMEGPGAVCTGTVHVDLTEMIETSKANALNADDGTFLKTVLGAKGLLKSDVDTDEQLLIYLPFKEAVNTSGIAILANGSNDEMSGPKVVKIFKDCDNLDFSDAEDAEAHLEMNLTPEQLNNGEWIKLPYHQFQNIRSLTVFVEKNQDDTDVSFLNRISVKGVTRSGTNMSELKKVG